MLVWSSGLTSWSLGDRYSVGYTGTSGRGTILRPTRTYFFFTNIFYVTYALGQMCTFIKSCMNWQYAAPVYSSHMRTSR